MIRSIFGARGQAVVGIVVFVISIGFWVIGTLTIPHAASLPQTWSPGIFIFHASMFALVIASYNIISTALGYRATERVEEVVADKVDVEHADKVEVG